MKCTHDNVQGVKFLMARIVYICKRLYKNNKFKIPGTIIASLISPLIDIIGYFYLFCTACIFSGIGKKKIFI